MPALVITIVETTFPSKHEQARQQRLSANNAAAEVDADLAAEEAETRLGAFVATEAGKRHHKQVGT